MEILNDLFRKEVWEEYRDLECRVRFLKGIVQNSMNITEEMMKEHNEMTSKVVDQLNDINLRIRNRVYNSRPIKKKNMWMCVECRARYKMLEGVAEKPDQCECGSREFRQNSSFN